MPVMSSELANILACPRCDKSPLEQTDDIFHCAACEVDFPSIDGIPWMFAEPEASLGEWLWTGEMFDRSKTQRSELPSGDYA